MTENLRLTLTSGKAVEIASNSTGVSAGTWTPTSTTGDGSASAAINRNTAADDPTTHQWYYSWWAATAGATNSSGDATNSICPVGWRMPPSSGNKSYQNLYSAYGSGGVATLESSPLDFARLGGYIDGEFKYNIYGYYWEPRAYNDSTAYHVNYSSAYGVNLAYTYNGYKRLGFNVRCVNATN